MYWFIACSVRSHAERGRRPRMRTEGPLHRGTVWRRQARSGSRTCAPLLAGRVRSSRTAAAACCATRAPRAGSVAAPSSVRTPGSIARTTTRTPSAATRVPASTRRVLGEAPGQGRRVTRAQVTRVDLARADLARVDLARIPGAPTAAPVMHQRAAVTRAPVVPRVHEADRGARVGSRGCWLGVD